VLLSQFPLRWGTNIDWTGTGPYSKEHGILMDPGVANSNFNEQHHRHGQTPPCQNYGFEPWATGFRAGAVRDGWSIIDTHRMGRAAINYQCDEFGHGSTIHFHSKCSRGDDVVLCGWVNEAFADAVISVALPGIMAEPRDGDPDTQPATIRSTCTACSEAFEGAWKPVSELKQTCEDGFPVEVEAAVPFVHGATCDNYAVHHGADRPFAAIPCDSIQFNSVADPRTGNE
jgi:hypothetical protein